MVVDDAALVEVDLGLRMQLSAAAWEAVLEQLLGDRALNMDKLAEEGAFLPIHILWGLTTNVQALTFALPEHKIARAQFVLDDPAYDPRRWRIRVTDLQVLRGNLQHWSLAQPLLLPELAVVDRLLKGTVPGQIWVSGEHHPAHVCEESGGTIEFLRLLVGRPDFWGASFRSSFAQALSPAERWSLPFGVRRVWAGGDASLDRIGFTDWSRRCCFAVDLVPYIDSLRRLLDSEEETRDVIIAVCELLAVVAGAAEGGKSW